MEKKEKMSEETYDLYLSIDKESNYYFIKNDEEKHVAVKVVDMITMERINGLDNIVTKESYYDVVSGECVYKLTKNYSLVDNKETVISENENIKVYLLSDVLGLKEDEEVYLSLEDINALVTSKEKTNMKK